MFTFFSLQWHYLISFFDSIYDVCNLIYHEKLIQNWHHFFFFSFFFSTHKSLYIEYWSTKILFSPFISFSFQILQEDFSRRNIIQNLKKVVNNDVPLAVKNFNFFQTLSLSVESLIPVPDGHNAECLAYLEDLKCLLRWNKWIWLWTTLSINFWMYIFWTKNVF